MSVQVSHSGNVEPTIIQDADQWTIDERGNLHVFCKEQGTLATFARFKWESVGLEGAAKS